MFSPNFYFLFHLFNLFRFVSFLFPDSIFVFEYFLFLCLDFSSCWCGSSWSSDWSDFDDAWLVLSGLLDVSELLLELLQVNLWWADNLHFVDLEVTKWDDRVATLDESVGQDVVREQGNSAVQCDAADALLHNLCDAEANPLLEFAWSIAVLGQLALLLCGEGNDENTECAVILCLGVDNGLNHCAPLAEHGAEFVGCNAHAVECGEQVASLDVCDLQLHLLERLILCCCLIKIRKVGFVNAALHVVLDGAGADCLVAQCLCELTGLEVGWCNDVEPFLARHGFDDLLLGATLAALADALVLADGHFLFRFFVFV